MPYKKRLTKKQMRAAVSLALDMRRRGIPIPILPEWRDCDPLTFKPWITGPSTVFQPKTGPMAAYEIRVHLTARERVTLTDCEIICGWDDQIELENPTLQRGDCWFAGRSYDSRQVLNTRLPGGFTIQRGGVVEAIILASSLLSIPERYQQGSCFPCHLTFTYGDGEDFYQPYTTALLIGRREQRERTRVAENNIGSQSPAVIPPPGRIGLHERPLLPHHGNINGSMARREHEMEECSRAEQGKESTVPTDSAQQPTYASS